MVFTLKQVDSNQNCIVDTALSGGEKVLSDLCQTKKRRKGNPVDH